MLYNFLVNQMSHMGIFRLVALPFFKITNKSWHSSTQPTSSLFKQIHSSCFLPKIPQKTQELQTPFCSTNIAEPPIKIPPEETTEEDEEELLLQQQQDKQTSCTSKQLIKNHINHRIHILQYEANNPSEDACTYEQLHSIDAYTVSIFDGHGGPQLAQYSKSKITKFIDSYLQDNLKSPKYKKQRSVGQIIKESIAWSYQKLEDTFFQIYQQQIKIGNKKIKNVGTCGITAIVHNDKVYVGNSGDSQGIFITNDGDSTFKSTKANKRLSVNNKSERQRLKKEWAGIDQNILKEQYNNCFYLKGRLQPTRTIGDYYLKKKEYYNGDDVFAGPYLNCKPDISQHQITRSHKYMVIASDGLWDVLNREEVTESLLGQKQIDLNKTCYDLEDSEQAPYVHSVLNSALNRICQKSGHSLEQLKQIQKGTRRNFHDDITIAVVNLQNQC